MLKVGVDGGRLLVEVVGGRQVFEFEIGKHTAVVSLSEAAFYVDGRYNARIAFSKDGSGRVTGATLNPGPWQKIGRRID